MLTLETIKWMTKMYIDVISYNFLYNNVYYKVC